MITHERFRAGRSLLTASLLAFGVACGGANDVSTNKTAAGNRNLDVAHSSNQQRTGVEQPGAGSGGAEPSGGAPPVAPRAPGGTPVDTSTYDAEIKRLEAALQKRASDAQTKQELADAYAARAARLTEVQQSRSALGDWRRTAKLDPSNEQAQNMIATITSIMQSMNRPLPAPGEEPTPLPFTKG